MSSPIVAEHGSGETLRGLSDPIDRAGRVAALKRLVAFGEARVRSGQQAESGNLAGKEHEPGA